MLLEKGAPLMIDESCGGGIRAKGEAANLDRSAALRCLPYDCQSSHAGCATAW